MRVHKHSTEQRRHARLLAKKRKLHHHRKHRLTRKQKQAIAKMKNSHLYALIRKLRTESIDKSSTEIRKAYIDAVLEAATKLDAKDAIAFTQNFLKRDPSFTQTPEGLAATLFEAYLIEKESALYMQLVETVVEDGFFTAMFEGKVKDDQMERVQMGLEEVMRIIPLIYTGEVSHSQQEVSDVTLYKVVPLDQQGKQLEQRKLPVMDKHGVIRSELEEASDLSGMARNAPMAKTKQEHEQAADYHRQMMQRISSGAKTHHQNAMWAHQKASKSGDDVDSRRANMASTFANELPDTRSHFHEGVDDLSMQRRELFKSMLPTVGLKSVYGTWEVKEGEVRVGGITYQVQVNEADARNAIQSISKMYMGLPHEADVFIGEVLREYCQSNALSESVDADYEDKGRVEFRDKVIEIHNAHRKNVTNMGVSLVGKRSKSLRNKKRRTMFKTMLNSQPKLGEVTTSSTVGGFVPAGQKPTFAPNAKQNNRLAKLRKRRSPDGKETPADRKAWEDYLEANGIDKSSMTVESLCESLAKGMAVDSREDINKPLQKQYTQYIVQGDTYSPAGPIKLAEKMNRFAYKVSMGFSRPVFTKMRPKTDELYHFKDSVTEDVLKEIDRFWDLKEDYARLGIMHSRGIILYGPPGSGKTSTLNQVAEMIVSRGDVVFYSKEINTLIEALKAFREVEQDRKVVVCLEDSDEYVGYQERAMLNLMSGENSQDGVLYLATTNYINRFPQRLLRPGRFDKKMYVGAPPYEGRLVFLKNKLKNVGETDKEIERLAKLTDKMMYSDLRELCAGVYALKEPVEEVLKRLRAVPLSEAHELVEKQFDFNDFVKVFPDRVQAVKYIEEHRSGYGVALDAATVGVGSPISPMLETVYYESTIDKSSTLNEDINEGSDHWSGEVKTHWTPPADFFKGSAHSIAAGLKSASKDSTQAMARLNFYINRAGKDAPNKAALLAAKKVLKATSEAIDKSSMEEGFENAQYKAWFNARTGDVSEFSAEDTHYSFVADEPESFGMTAKEAEEDSEEDFFAKLFKQGWVCIRKFNDIVGITAESEADAKLAIKFMQKTTKRIDEIRVGLGGANPKQTYVFNRRQADVAVKKGFAAASRSKRLGESTGEEKVTQGARFKDRHDLRRAWDLAETHPKAKLLERRMTPRDKTLTIKGPEEHVRSTIDAMKAAGIEFHDHIIKSAKADESIAMQSVYKCWWKDGKAVDFDTDMTHMDILVAQRERFGISKEQANEGDEATLFGTAVGNGWARVFKVRSQCAIVAANTSIAKKCLVWVADNLEPKIIHVGIYDGDSDKIKEAWLVPLEDVEKVRKMGFLTCKKIDAEGRTAMTSDDIPKQKRVTVEGLYGYRTVWRKGTTIIDCGLKHHTQLVVSNPKKFGLTDKEMEELRNDDSKLELFDSKAISLAIQHGWQRINIPVPGKADLDSLTVDAKDEATARDAVKWAMTQTNEPVTAYLDLGKGQWFDLDAEGIEKFIKGARLSSVGTRGGRKRDVSSESEEGEFTKGGFSTYKPTDQQKKRMKRKQAQAKFKELWNKKHSKQPKTNEQFATATEQGTEVFKNPSRKEWKECMTPPMRTARVLALPDGTLYAWNADAALHDDVIEELNLPKSTWHALAEMQGSKVVIFSDYDYAREGIVDFWKEIKAKNPAVEYFDASDLDDPEMTHESEQIDKSSMTIKDIVSKAGFAKVTEKTIGRIQRQTASDKGFMLLSADRGERSPKENEEHRKQLEQHLRSNGKGFTKVKGGYIETDAQGNKKPVYEHSYFVPNVNKEEAGKFAEHAYKKHGQEAVLWGHGKEGVHLINGKTGEHTHVGDTFTQNDIGDYYTQYHKKNFAFKMKSASQEQPASEPIKKLAASVGMEEDETPKHKRYIVVGRIGGSAEWEVKNTTADVKAHQKANPFSSQKHKYYDTQTKSYVKTANKEPGPDIEKLAPEKLWSKTRKEHKASIESNGVDIAKRSDYEDHARAVRAAHALGKPVRKEVLADYPHIANESELYLEYIPQGMMDALGWAQELKAAIKPKMKISEAWDATGIGEQAPVGRDGNVKPVIKNIAAQEAISGTEASQTPSKPLCGHCGAEMSLSGAAIGYCSQCQKGNPPGDNKAWAEAMLAVAKASGWKDDDGSFTNEKYPGVKFSGTDDGLRLEGVPDSETADKVMSELRDGLYRAAKVPVLLTDDILHIDKSSINEATYSQLVQKHLEAEGWTNANGVWKNQRYPNVEGIVNKANIQFYNTDSEIAESVNRRMRIMEGGDASFGIDDVQDYYDMMIFSSKDVPTAIESTKKQFALKHLIAGASGKVESNDLPDEPPVPVQPMQPVAPPEDEDDDEADAPKTGQQPQQSIYQTDPPAAQKPTGK